jgi:hypothetical protein
MRFLLAAEGGAIPLLLSRPESAESRAEELDLASVFRPVPRPLRGDRALVMRLRIAKQLADRPRRR